MPVLPSNKRTTTLALILVFVIHLFNVPHLLSLQSDMLSVLLPLVLASTILATPLAKQNMRQYTIYNKCPTAIDLYIAGAKGGAKDSTIPTKGSVVKSLATGPTTFFTDANGGRLTAEGTIRARFYNDVSPSQSYMYRGQNFIDFLRTTTTYLRTPIMPIPVCK